MRNFLAKFMSAEDLDKLEEAYKAKNDGATGLPVYIPKSRFDEVDSKRKSAEQTIAGFEAEKTKAVNEATAALKEQFKDIPKDWKEQLESAKNALETQKTEYEGKLKASEKSYEITSKIYESGARNVKAVRALLDDTKPIDKQLTDLKTSDPYLFSSGLPKGTGKDGGEGDGQGVGSKGQLSTEAMYAAVGVPFSK